MREKEELEIILDFALDAMKLIFNLDKKISDISNRIINKARLTQTNKEIYFQNKKFLCINPKLKFKELNYRTTEDRYNRKLII